jgi:hypothetical protein
MGCLPLARNTHVIARLHRHRSASSRACWAWSAVLARTACSSAARASFRLATASRPSRLASKEFCTLAAEPSGAWPPAPGPDELAATWLSAACGESAAAARPAPSLLGLPAWPPLEGLAVSAAAAQLSVAPLRLGTAPKDGGIMTTAVAAPAATATSSSGSLSSPPTSERVEDDGKTGGHSAKTRRAITPQHRRRGGARDADARVGTPTSPPRDLVEASERLTGAGAQC